MNRVLIICHDYHPQPSANTLCLDPILSRLTDDGADVDLVCVRPTVGLARREYVNGITVHRVWSLADLMYRLLRKVMADDTRAVHLIGSALYIAFMKVFSLYDEGYVSLWRPRAARMARRLIAAAPYDAMISVSLPFTANLVALDIKNRLPHLPWLMYQLDPFVYNYTLPDSKLERRMYLEHEVASATDGVVAAMGILEENARRAFITASRGEVVSLPLPNLHIRREDSNVGDGCLHDEEPADARINIVYSGAFYKGIRPPDGVVRLACDLPGDEFTFHILGGSSDSLFARLRLPESRLRIYGRVSADEAHRSIAEASVLLNVGNNLPNQVPSKLLSYMSSGKSILHILNHEADPALPLLESYERCMIVRASELDSEVTLRNIAIFCQTASSQPDLKESEIRSRMGLYASDSVVERFLGVLRRTIDGARESHE